MRKTKKSKNNVKLQQINLILYILLLIMTPFLLLQNYLQAAIGVASNASFTVAGHSIPYTVLIALILLLTAFILLRKRIRLYHILLTTGVLLLFWIGQQLTDFYFNHKFYELQHNWHYLAYSGFAILSWRYGLSKGKTSAQIILYTLVFAFSVSLLDEIAQVPLSNRVFDICDIAKDIYGAVIGNVFIFYVLEEGKNIPKKLQLTHPKLKDYFNNPLTLLVYEYLFVLIFLSITSILSMSEYFLIAFPLPVIVFIVIWFAIHLLQYKTSKILVTGLTGLMIVAGLTSFAIHSKKNITYNRYGITIYKGIPIPYLDIMIYENGTWRIVDKKHEFNVRDQRTILKYATDILLIGSGSDGLGGKGFPGNEPVQFIFNPNTGKMTQVIILRTPQACKLYNIMKKENKNVTFILHNTC